MLFQRLAPRDSEPLLPRMVAMHWASIGMTGRFYKRPVLFHTAVTYMGREARMNGSVVSKHGGVAGVQAKACSTFVSQVLRLHGHSVVYPGHRDTSVASLCPKPSRPSLANEAGSSWLLKEPTWAPNKKSPTQSCSGIERVADSQLNCRMLMGPREEDRISKVPAC